MPSHWPQAQGRPGSSSFVKTAARRELERRRDPCRTGARRVDLRLARRIFERAPRISLRRAVLLALAAAVIVWLLPETVKHRVRRWSAIALLPRIGVPRGIIGAFIAPAVTVFASFALLGFYSALAPSLLQRSLGIESHAVGGAVVFELYAAAVPCWRSPMARCARRDAVGAFASHPLASSSRRRVPVAPRRFSLSGRRSAAAPRRRLSRKPSSSTRSRQIVAAPRWSRAISCSATRRVTAGDRHRRAVGD